MSRKIVPIKYTSREFNSIKRDLTEYAKRYYPDSFQDFNEASFGALMLDTVAYVGDVLSFYLDYQANESFLDTAVEYNNIIRHGRQLGYKPPGVPSSFGEVSLYLMIPANATGLGPDLSYLPIMKAGSSFRSPSGTFTLINDVSFLDTNVEFVAGKIDASTGVPTHYAAKTTGNVVSGETVSKTVSVGDFTKFKRVRVVTRNIAEVISVVDSEGNEYYEVEHLSQNVIYKPVLNTNSDNDIVTNILKPVLAPRRFTAERNGNSMFLQFGHGSSEELVQKSVKDPKNIILNLHAKDYYTDREFDPSKLLLTDKFGIAPSNTTLTITYRVNSVNGTAAAAGAINAIRNINLEFANVDVLSANKINRLKGSAEVINDKAITGVLAETSSSDLKRRIMGHFAAQNRAVTRQDYLALLYTMPAEFGSVARANILRDPDSLKRNLNLYVIGHSSRGFLQTLTSTAKENIKTWLNENKMINDTIDIMDAKVVNYGIRFVVKAHPQSDKNAVYNRCRTLLAKKFAGTNNVLDIGEPLYISSMYTMLNRVRGVLDVKSIKIVPRWGAGYSDKHFDFDARKSADGTYISTPDNVVLELRFPKADIRGTVK